MQEDASRAAVKWASAGCSVIPIRADGTKRPVAEWKTNQQVATGAIPLAEHFKEYPAHGIGIVCGKVSKNLEMLELEGRATSEDVLLAICDKTEELGVGEVWNSFVTDGYAELTPSGGLHLLYRIVGHDVPGNEKVARRPATPEELAEKPLDKIKVLAETRGEGGYVIVAPTGGTVHPTGYAWEVESGEIGKIPTVTWEERCLLHQAVHDVLDEMPEEAARERPNTQRQRDLRPGDGRVDRTSRPGDAYNERADWADILEPHGWTVHHMGGGTTYWTRPGKSRRDGHSATTGHAGTGAEDRLYVMSSATEFATDEPMSKFYVYAHYEHGGNFANATKALAAQGYGDRQTKPLSNVDRSLKMPPPKDADSAPEAAERSFYDNTHVGNAERMFDSYGHNFRYVPETKQWMHWDEQKWALDHGLTKVTGACIDMTRDIRSEAAQSEDKSQWKWFHTSQMDSGIKGTISQLSRMEGVAARPEAFDNTPGLLNLPNGVYDLDNHVLLPADRKYMMTQMFGTPFDPSASCPQFEQLIATLIPDSDLRGFVQRAVGYSLLGRPDQRAMFITHGPKRTGKSQFHNILSLLFGDYAGTAQAGSFHRVERRGDAASPGLHALRNKRFVTTSEESEHAVLDTESLKRLTGNEAITTRALYQDGQQWRPQMVLWMATNPLPQLNSDDDAIWDRIKPIPFTTKFSARGEDGTIKETPGIAEKIFAEEAAGIFNWALAGLRMFQECGGLDQPEQIEQGVADYRHETDPVSQYWTQMADTGQISTDSASRVEFQVLYESYVNWCVNSREHPLSSRRFGRRIRAVTGIGDFVRSNGKYYVPGCKWTPTGGWIAGLPGAAIGSRGWSYDVDQVE